MSPLKINIWLKYLFSLFLLCDLNIAQAIPFAGVDFQKRYLRFQDNAGKGFFQEHAFQYDLYLGVRTDYYGVDLGYFANKNKNRTAMSGRETHYTEIKIKGPHVDLLGFYPLAPSYGIEFLGGIGAAYSKLMLKNAIVELDQIYLSSPIAQVYDIKKIHARALVGLQCLLYQNIGCRASVTWENMASFDVPATQLKNSWIYGVGLYGFFA